MTDNPAKFSINKYKKRIDVATGTFTEETRLEVSAETKEACEEMFDKGWKE